MPVYQITGKNGKTYQIEGPPNATREQIIKAVLRQAPEAGVPPQEENVLEKVPLVGDLLAGAVDLPLEFIGGLAGTSKSFTDALEARGASKFLDDVAEGALGLRSSESRRDALINAIDEQMAEGRGIWEETKSAVRRLGRSPLDITASVTGSAVPFIGAGLAAGAAAPATGGASVIVPAAAMAGVGAVSGAGLIKGEIYDAVYEATYEAAVESGIDEQTAKAKAEEIAEKAQAYDGKNLDQIGLGAALGAVASATGFSRQIASTIGQRAAQRLAQRAAARAAGTKGPGAVRSFITGAAEEAIPEALQAGQERYAANLAQQREGFDIDEWRGVAGQAAFEGLASLVLGGYGGVRSAKAERRLLDATAAEFNAITPDADERTVTAAVGRFMKRGFNQETAESIVRNMQVQKALIEEQAAKMEQQRREEMEARTAGVEPSPEPDITAPGMVREGPEFAAPPEDPEVVAERMRAYEAQMGGAAQAAPTARPGFDPESFRNTVGEVPAIGQPVEGGHVTDPDYNYRALSQNEIDAIRLEGWALPQDGARKRGANKKHWASGDGKLHYKPDATIIRTPKEGFTADAPISAQAIEVWNTETGQFEPIQATPMPTPSRRGPPQPMDLTPERAGTILSDPVALSDYEASGGDVEALYEIAEGTYEGPSIKYSRGRRPVDTTTPDMFAGAPLQEAPGIEAKREELAAQRFATDEERLARQEQAAAEMKAGQQRVAQRGAREAEQRQRHLEFIQSILRGKAPENAVYKVVYDPEDANPYKLVAETQPGKKPELVLQAKTRQEFSDAVYEQMEELTPYVPPAPAAIQEIEERETGEQKFPTVATRMMQEFTAEVDAAREAGLIDNLQRSELLRRLERPNAYRPSPNGERMIPNDAIAKREKEAIDAASAANNATAEERDAATAAAQEANDRLAAAVKNSLLNPARAALKSMVEMRQDERLGARVRQREAEGVIGKYAARTAIQKDFAPKRGEQKLERVPGRAAGKEQIGIEGIGETKAEPAQRPTLRRKTTGTTATDEATFGALSEEETTELREAQKEAREAKIDLAQQRVQKYRKGAEKQPGGPPKLVSVADVQAMVDKITAQWKSTNPVVVVESVLDIKDRKLRRAIMKDNALDANGLIAPDGTIYLVANNLLSIEDAKSVLFHEALGHLGLEKLFRNNLDNALVTMYRGNAKLRADTDKWRSENRGAYENDANPLARAVEEVLAERSERGQLERSLFDKIAAIVRNFARRMGINLKISDGDVAAILSMAHDKVVSGDIESAIVKGLRYVTAWHGSPYDFSQFTLGAIGSGEGHAAYGWGLYFGGTREVGKHYRDQEAARRATVDGKSMTRGKGRRFVEYGGDFTREERAALMFLRNTGTFEYTVNRLQRDIDSKFSSDAEKVTAQEKLNVLNSLRDSGRLQVVKGALYEVQLAPKPDEWLDWHTPISEQSQKVQKALATLGLPTEEEGAAYPLTGADVYNQLRRQLGSKKEASLALLNVGIRGNKYLDGWSRGARDKDNPTFNYVLFSDDDVEITAKYSRKMRDKAQKAAEGLSAGARRVKDTVSVYGMEDGLKEATGANNKVRDALTYAEDMSSPVRIGALKTMPTSGILNWLKRKASAEIHSLAKRVDDTISKMGTLRASLAQAAEPIERDMDDFTRKYGSEALAELRFTARINGVDPLAFKDMEAALKGDAVLKPIEDALLKNSNNKAETRRLIDEIKEQVAKSADVTQVFKDKVKLSTPVRVKLNALTKLAIDNSKVRLKVDQLAGRTQEIRDTYIAKEALAKQKGGLELYKAERDYHKDMFDARVALLDERGIDSFNPEQAKKVREVRAEIMREVKSPEERQKGGDLFWDIDPELFAKDYFPMVRDGDYWLRVSEDLKAQREEALYVFRSARELAKAQRQLARQLGVDPNDRTVLKSGNRLADLQNTIRSEDELMKRVFDIVDKAKAQQKDFGKVDMQELVDAIYQTYLLTTPERSARRRFMHAKEIAGFSLNVYDNFRKQVATNANELTKLAYAGKVRADVNTLKSAIDSPERSGEEAVMLDDFARELEFRAEQEINPPPPGTLNAAINALNRVSFLYFLTSAKTALTNFTNLPIRVVPRFWRDYGVAEGTAMWLKYMQMWKSLGRVKVERTNMRFGDYLDAIMPNVNGSSFVKNNADLQWALRAGTERGILMTTADTIAQSERGNPLRQQTGAVRTAQDVTANTLKSMTFLFTGTENISRQATFYMSFELALNKFRKENRPNKGETDKAYTERARQQALREAVDIVNDTIGNFANWERPSLTKGELARGFFLFKMHPILQTKFMVGAFRDIIAAPLRGAARQATGRGKLTKEDTAEVVGALKELSGVLMMGGLMGGLAGMPLYTIMVEALAYAFEPDPDDDDDVNKLMKEDVANVYDADISFRRWLSNYLGVDESGESQLANILIDGPVGVLTDTEMSSTVSLDIVKLWYREPIAGDNLEDTAVAALIANVAGLSTVSQVLRGLDNFADGNIREGLKKVAPAFFRSWINAYYNSTEGVKNIKDDTIIPKEKITASDTFRSALGARSLRLAKWQDYSITALKNEDRINKERQEIFDEIEQMRNDGEFATMDDFREYWNEVVVPFNRTYPNERFIITEEAIENSLKRRDERRARTVDGRTINKKDAERILRSQEMFTPK